MLLRCVLAIFFSLALALPAEAALTLGVVPEKGNYLRSEVGVRQQTEQLEQLLNEKVRFRVFRSEADLNEWMQRYRMVDLALVSQSFFSSQPAGSLTLLRQASATDLVVARPGLHPETLKQLRSAVATIDFSAPSTQPRAKPVQANQSARKTGGLRPPGEGELQPGHEILATPGQTPQIMAQPVRPPRPAKAKKPQSARQAKPGHTTSAKPTPTAAAETQKPAPVTKQLAPALDAPNPPAGAPAPDKPQSGPNDSLPTVPAPANQESVPAPAVTSSQPQAQVTEPETDSPFPLILLGVLVLASAFGSLYVRRRKKRPSARSAAPSASKPAPALVPARSATPPNAPPLEENKAPNRPMPMSPIPMAAVEKELDPPVAEVPVAAAPAAIPLADESPAEIDARAALLDEVTPLAAAEQPFEGQPSLGMEDLPPLDLDFPSGLEETPAPTAEKEVPYSDNASPEPNLDPAPAVTEPVIKKAGKSPSEFPPLRGNIATVNIPRLLEAAAAQPGPCVLQINGRHDEKRLHFRKGHLVNAVSVNRANRTKTGFLMNKVGYLLIRQGRISEEQRDQALQLCKERPKLRIGEALLELGALTRDSLVEALQTQVESIIFSLFIFPDGRYEIVADDTDTPAANDLNINLEALLSKAETQEPEWKRIRQAIPSLDVILDFPEGGRDKLDSARMTEHQQLVLSLIDGQRPIRDICIAATMLDLEVYKFLFFMVNAKILTQVPAS